MPNIKHGFKPTSKFNPKSLTVFAVAFAIVGSIALLVTHAAGPTVSLESENGTVSCPAAKGSDATASGGSYVQFKTSCGTGGEVAGTNHTCNFFTVTNPTPAFCDNFTKEQPSAISVRSGPLSPVWGVSRLSNDSNPPQGQYDLWAGVKLGAENDMPTPSSVCGGVGNVLPPNDISVSCAGAPGLVETTNDGDNDTQTVWAAYPRQPFDVAGRTGTVSFDVTNNTQVSAHGAWPTWAFTDQPVPTPNSFLPPEATANTQNTANAKNSVGVDFGQLCQNAFGNNQCSSAGSGFNYPPGYNKNTDTCVTVNHIWTTANYLANYINFKYDGCVRTSYVATTCYGPFTNDSGSNAAGPVVGCTPGSLLPATGMDHIEIQLNSTGIYVYGSSYTQGSSSGDYSHPYLLADAQWGVGGNPPLPLTRGLTWMEDVHYNANKFDRQSLNTFQWGNYGFDGPVLARDLAYDVPDANASAGTTPADSYTGLSYPYVNLGYQVPTTGNKTFTINNVNPTGGSGALIVFNWWPFYDFTNPVMKASVNGNTPIAVQDPNPPNNSNGLTGAIAVPINQIVNGTNTIAFTAPGSNTATVIANIDLIIIGAGGTFSP